MNIKDIYDTFFAHWMRVPEKLRYLLVGGFNTLVSYALYAWFLWMMSSKYPQTALALSFFASSPISFWTQRIFVFCSKNDWILAEYFKCLCAWGVNYTLNAILLYVFTNTLSMNPYWAQFIAVLCITVTGYLMLKHIAFKSQKGRKS